MQLRPYQQDAIEEAWNQLKLNDEPVLFHMSVGGGKSICIATILKRIEDAGKRVLCLVNSSELVRNNSEAFRAIGGNPGIFCASLGKKDTAQPVIFATPQSVMRAVNAEKPLADITFSMIVVDEAHNIPYHLPKSTYMRILRHYKHLHPPMRLLGLTGTPFRGEGHAIVGEGCLFKHQVANVTMSYLIQHGYLARPRFGKPKTRGFDFSHVKVKNTGDFDHAELEAVIHQDERLTGQILREVSELVGNRNGAFIFCATVKHCHEALRALENARIITGETPEDERHSILMDAREGRLKYLISVNCLMVGIDVPRFDVVVWLRPTTSLVLYTQGIGRGLRLFPDKQDALILDYAGNLERHRDAIEDPELLEPLKAIEDKDQPKVFECQKCFTWNTEHARRCVGVTDSKRCDYYFEFKACPRCQVQNDIVSRHCRGCDFELIDPNRNLRRETSGALLDVDEMRCAVFGAHRSMRFTVTYLCEKGIKVYETYTFAHERAVRVFYGKFLKLHHPSPGLYYTKLGEPWAMQRIIRELIVPRVIEVVQDGQYLKIVKKHFQGGG